MEEDLKLPFEHIEEGNSKGWFGRIREILRSSKPLNELITEERFLVECVNVETSIVRISVDNTRYGDYGNALGLNNKPFDDIFNDLHLMSDFDGGLVFNCELKVKPYSTNCPITTLTFFGYTPAMAGHVVTAKIAKYTTHIFRHNHRKFYRKSKIEEKQKVHTDRSYFTDRPYNTIEQALNIAICDGDKILRNDKSPQYNKSFI